MNELEKLQQQKTKILKLIPRGKTSTKQLIISFEKIAKISRKIGLFDLSAFLYRSKDKDFEKMNTYFKKVHAVIREKAEKHPLYDENLEVVVLNNFKAGKEITFSKKKMGKAYQTTLNFYDPNKKQSKRDLHFNWNGFWSLITTKNGVVTGVYLSDTMDRDIFFEAMRKL